MGKKFNETDEKDINIIDINQNDEVDQEIKLEKERLGLKDTKAKRGITISPKKIGIAAGALTVLTAAAIVIYNVTKGDASLATDALLGDELNPQGGLMDLGATDAINNVPTV